MKFMDIKINNSKKAAIPIKKTRKISGQWKDPGAKLYDQLLNAYHIEGNRVPDDSEEFKKIIEAGKYTTWQHYLKEAYMVAPVNDINNSPYGVTPYSRSGCKYPHHVIKNGELVVSIPGLRAAYITARNNGVLVNHTPENKQIVAHFNRHFKELGLKPEWHYGEFYLVEESVDSIIDNNFRQIYSFIMEKTGINLFDDIKYFDEASHGNMNESAMSNEAIIFSSEVNKEIGTTPEEIYEWMHSNIKYNDGDEWKLRTPSEVFIDKKGNCHDQALFEAFLFHSLNIVNGQLFFVEVDDNGCFGNSHTLTWFRKGGNGYSDFKEPYDETKKYDCKYEYFWFEVAWETQAGIHGPYNSVYEIKDAVTAAYNNDNDINSRTCNKIVFSTFSNYRCGMSIEEYVESWRLDKDPVNTINESAHVEYIYEKSHGSLKYCYRVGFDVNSGKEVAIEFILEPDSITSVGDTQNIKHASMKSGTKVNVLKVAEDAVTSAKENIKKYGHIDFTTDNLKVHKIFFRNGESAESIDFIPMFSKEVTASMNKVARLYKMPRGTSSLTVFNHDQFPSILQQEIGSNNRSIEHYQVGKIGGKDKYKTTKLMWDHDLFLSYKYTPVLRGVNGKGRYIYNKPEDINDMKEYLKKNLNNKYSESYMDDINIVNSIFTESIFHGYTSIGVNIPYDIGYGYSGDMSIDDIYTEAITFDTDSMNDDHTSIMEYVNERMDWIQKFANDDEFRDSISDVQLIESLDNLCDELMSLTGSIDYYAEDVSVDTNDPHDINSFKKRWNYDESKKTIAFENREYRIEFIFPDKSANTITNILDGSTYKDNNGIEYAYVEIQDNKPIIYVNDVYFKSSAPIQDMVLLHEIGHIVYQFTPKPLPSNVRELIQKIKGLIQKLIARIRMRKYRKGIHGNPYHELEADAFAIKHIGAKRFAELITKAMQDSVKNQPIPAIIANIKNKIKEDDIKKAYNGYVEDCKRHGKNDYLSYDDFKKRYFILRAEEIKKCMMNIKANEIKDNKDVAQRLRAANDTKLQNSKYFKKESEDIDLMDMEIIDESTTLKNLPDKMYFGTPNKLQGRTISTKSPRGLFLTPYIGIASMFIVDISKELDTYISNILKKNGRELIHHSCNIEYDEWDSDELDEPLDKTHISHNIPEFNEIKDGTTSGYIYQVDVSKIKNQLQSYGGNGSKELVYKGDDKLPITGVMPHTIEWTIKYKANGEKGTFETRVIKESALFVESEDNIETPPPLDEEQPVEQPEKESMPKQTDRAESDKNGVRRKKLYIAFIEWCKAYNNKNVFGSIFDKDAFKITYPFIPEEMRYFYRLANPILCVLGGDLTFFQASELRKLNSSNHRMSEILIFAATPNDMRIFNIKDKKVYRGTEENGQIKLNEVLGPTFDLYIQNMIKQGDILNGPIEESFEEIEFM